MNYAIAKINGHQYQVKEGQEIFIEKLTGEKGDTVTLDQILLIVDGEKKIIGKPLIEKAKIIAKITEQTKGKKIRVATYKSKARQRKVIGHRKHLTKIIIEKISLN